MYTCVTRYSLHTGIRSRLGHDYVYQGVPKSDQLEGSFSSLPLLNRPEGVSYTTILNSPTGKLSTARGWRSRDRTPWPHYIFDLYVDFAWPCARRCLLSRARWLAGSRLGVSVHPMPHKFLPMARGRANISFAG